MPNAAPLLSIERLNAGFALRRGTVQALTDVDLTLERGQTLALVGESGSGKTVLALSVLRLLQPPGKILSGRVRLEGRDLLALPERDMRAVRGAKISMIFQEPMTSLNPVLTIGDQVAEVFRLRGVPRREALDRAAEALSMVGIQDPVKRLSGYPQELSGGMRQRVVIAMALALDPAVVLADEPTTALDVTVQAQILDLMLDLKERRGSSILLITHDMGVVAETSQRVAVMYAGRVVEEGPVEPIFRQPRHPYTQGLLRSIPRLPESGERTRRLAAIPGVVPGLGDMPAGCPFHPRCDQVFDRCRLERPELAPMGDDRRVRCFLYE